jgi:uncharacterized protein (DUF4415 family)
MNEENKWKEARRKALDYAASLSDEEDAKLTAAALADPDAQPWTDEMWARATTFEERQKQRAHAKVACVDAATGDVLNIDAEVIEHFRKTGNGWQARLNAVLRKAAGLS